MMMKEGAEVKVVMTENAKKFVSPLTFQYLTGNKVADDMYDLEESGISHIELADEHDLILVDTKYEFGLDSENNILLIDEIHTPDSSRYFYIDGYEDKIKSGESPKQLSKEFVRQWLIDNGFQGKEGQVMPEMSQDYCNSVSDRYIELFEYITGDNFIKEDVRDVVNRVEKNILNYLGA